MKSILVHLKRFRWIALIAALALNFGGFAWSPVAADSTQSPATIGWASVTPAARFRGPGDWLLDTGFATPAAILGPFPSHPYRQGATEQFYALDVTQPRPRMLTAHLLLVTEHAYWWFEDGTDIDPNAVALAGKRFETEIYPMDHILFGQEWAPGIDGDPHIFILHEKEIGSYAVGVFSPRDECPRTVCRVSNQHEMLYLGLDFGPPNSPQELTDIAHELQHLIHYNNGGEQRWLDEGLSQLAEHLNGFDPRFIADSSLKGFLRAPNFQLDSWPSSFNQDPGINYAVSYIFCVYLYQRFGVSFIQHLAQSPYKGLAGVDETLRALKIGEPVDQVVTDWMVTNYVNSPYVGDGRYYYQSLQLPQRPSTTDLVLDQPHQEAVAEYGAEYLQLSEAGSYSLSFQGDTAAKLADIRPTSGQWMWWSYNEPQGAARLERDFDLTRAKSPELTFNAWWDTTSVSLGQILVSSDGGQHWDVVAATDTQPCRFVGRYPCFMGQSKNWQRESVDLSHYAGEKIRVRFEYLTDGASGQGFFLDDLALPAIGYRDNVETDDAKWQKQGFMRVTGSVPQYWAVNVITTDTPPKVQLVALTAKNGGRLTFTAPQGGAVVVVGAMAPFVQGTANYTIQVHKNQ